MKNHNFFSSDSDSPPMLFTTPLIEGHNLTVRKGTKTIFSQLNFKIPPGVRMAIRGPNGIGKSTLLELFAGVQRAQDNNPPRLFWTFSGVRESSRLVPRQKARLVSPLKQLHYVRQNWAIRGEDIILAGFWNKDLCYQQASFADREQVHALAQNFNAEKLLSLPLCALSQGQLRLLLLLQALISKPDLLLLDEPFSGLSPQTKHTTENALLEILNTNMSVIFSSHHNSDLLDVLSHVLYLEKEDLRPKSTTPVGFHPAGLDPSSPKNGSVRFYCSSPRAFLYERHRTNQVTQQAARKFAAVGQDSPSCDKSNPPYRKNIPSLCHRFFQNSPEKNTTFPPGGFSEALLQLEHVDVFIQRTKVLHQLSWRIFPGEQWLVSGENGAGKSVLLRLLYGDETAAYGGSVTWCGRPRPPLPLFRQHVAYVSDRLHQKYRYDLPVLQVVASGLTGAIGLYEALPPHLSSLAANHLADFQLAHLAQTPFSLLSTGEARRALLARAMMCSPALLLLDEPCSGLDATSRRLYQTLLETLIRQQVQIIYVSHCAAEIPAGLTHELQLEHGAITVFGKRPQPG